MVMKRCIATAPGQADTNETLTSAEETAVQAEHDAWDAAVDVWDEIRAVRHPLMQEAVDVLDENRNQLDFTIPAKITGAKAQDWADYLQELRDVTIDFATPDDVVWPTKPT